jgi:hypothetical protein
VLRFSCCVGDLTVQPRYLRRVNHVEVYVWRNKGGKGWLRRREGGLSLYLSLRVKKPRRVGMTSLTGAGRKDKATPQEKERSSNRWGLIAKDRTLLT